MWIFWDYKTSCSKKSTRGVILVPSSSPYVVGFPFSKMLSKFSILEPSLVKITWIRYEADTSLYWNCVLPLLLHNNLPTYLMFILRTVNIHQQLTCLSVNMPFCLVTICHDEIMHVLLCNSCSHSNSLRTE